MARLLSQYFTQSVCAPHDESGPQRLFRDFHMDLQRITLLPPVACRLGPAMRLLYPVLAAVPPLRTHYLALLVKP